MKNLVIVISFLIIFVFNLSGQEFGSFDKSVLFESGSLGFFVYRIPAIVVTSNNNILVFAEGRKGKGEDWDESSIVMKASYDGGISWTKPRILVSIEKMPCSNVVPVVDYYNNKVHLLYVVNYKNIFYICSEDEGLNWSQPINITDACEGLRKKYDWKILATGPGHGIQLRNGRMIVPIWLSSSVFSDTTSRTLAHYPSVTSVLYSNDFGKSWLLGDIIAPHNDTLVFPNEATAVELKSGEVMFNMRNESINYRRLVSTSPDGISNWSAPVFSDNFFEPICHASIIRYSMVPYQDKDRILFVNPDSRMVPWSAKRGSYAKAAPKRQRSNLTLRISYDEALTFPVSKTIDSGFAGYSDLAVSPNGIIYCIYESGAKAIYNNYLPMNISLASFDLVWATNAKDSLSPHDMPLDSYIKCVVENINIKPEKRRKIIGKKKIKSC